MVPSTEARPRTAAVLLAAGAAQRYGSAKQLAEVDGQPLIRRGALAALDAGLELLVVTGAHAAPVAAALHGLEATLLHNADWAQGMGRSISVAFTYLHALARHDHALICLSDQPLVCAEQLRRLLAAHRHAEGGITAAWHGTTFGPPCAFARRWFDRLAELDGPHGARALLMQHADILTRVDMPEAACDVDTPADLAALPVAQRN
jgi:molybdenum cofactor cytidylyltransferase